VPERRNADLHQLAARKAGGENGAAPTWRIGMTTSIARLLPCPASYSTMNGPVLWELEKRHQREALVQQLQDGATRHHHGTLTLE